MLADDRCPLSFYGTKEGWQAPIAQLTKEQYHHKLKNLDIKELHDRIVELMTNSQSCWPADGPQDGDVPSYAGLFGRLAWHCAGTVQEDPLTGEIRGGCEGGRQTYWPENQWHDNANLDKARALLSQIKRQYVQDISWGDLITFAGTVAIKASGGPAKKFCFGRLDDSDGKRSISMQVDGTNGCERSHLAQFCKKDNCTHARRFPAQDEADPARCEVLQENHRVQGSHSIGLIYVYPHGPALKSDQPGFNRSAVHNRNPAMSAWEVRDTFNKRMGWTDRETVALIGGGHTLGRAHGNCNLTGTRWADKPFNGEGPWYEAVEGSGRGPTDGTCGTGAEAGLGENTVTSGFEGPWTRTPSQWNYDYFHAMFTEKWTPAKSPFGNDQWQTEDRSSTFKHTFRLTADMALVADEAYRAVALEYAKDHAKFDSDFADAWFKLVHRSADHPHPDDLEHDAGVCTDFNFAAFLV
jgi:catalase-peroxidase